MNEKIEIITITASKYMSQELAEKIAAAQWGSHEYAHGIRSRTYMDMTGSDCFNVIAQNESNEVVGRLYCIRNAENTALWYYGDLFVIPQYRRRHIALRMITAAIEILRDKGCETLRLYTGSDNTASIKLQIKNGFAQKPYEPFNDLIHDEGELMFEKELGSPNHAVPAKSRDDARYIARFYGKNIKKLHGKEKKYSDWCEMLSQNDPDEKNYLICRGVMPVAWLKINGLEQPDTGYISMLAVEPTFQHMGIGKFAVSYAEDMLRSIGKGKIAVQTTADNIPAISLYKKCGFKETGNYPHTAEDGSETVRIVFSKNI